MPQEFDVLLIHAPVSSSKIGRITSKEGTSATAMVIDIGEVFLVLIGMVKLETRGEATDVVMHPPLLTITMVCGRV